MGGGDRQKNENFSFCIVMTIKSNLQKIKKLYNKYIIYAFIKMKINSRRNN